MAPESSHPKRKPTENRHLFHLGVRGRKTGLTVADSGIRDENGLEPMDNLFSSPEKVATGRKLNGKTANVTISSEEDMDVDENTLPELNNVILERASRGSMRLPPPRSKSPIKTFLQSPARRNPSLGPVSSPSRGSVVKPQPSTASASVRRKLDFSSDNLNANTLEASIASETPQKRGNSALKTASAKLSNGTRLAPQKRFYTNDYDEDNQDNTAQTEEDVGFDVGDDSVQMVYGDEHGVIDDIEDEREESEVPEPEPEPQSSKKSKGKAKAVESETVTVPAKRGRGRRPKHTNSQQVEEDADGPPAKRTRRSLEGPVAVPEPVSKPKHGRPAKPVASQPKSKAAAKAVAKKPKLAPISEAESPEAQRGPPLPRNNRGLMILRRETPMDGASFKQTRSGRNSIKPLAYWKSERVEYSEDEMEDAHGKFLTQRIKGVVRVDEIEEKRRKKSYHKPSKGKKRATVEESDEETEPWEDEPGRIIAPYRLWDPEDPTSIQQPEEEAELALSSAAIITRDIPGATFKFAKTLTLPFFGSGMVDLPAGTEKKVKNSRRMQMVFFVYYGRVEVTVNDTTFGIGKGGMWQVPRGNTYSIVNDYEKPARIFFAQGCEIMEEFVEDTR